jgi:hypothetical protein
MPEATPQYIGRGSSALPYKDKAPLVHVLHRDYETRSTLVFRHKHLNPQLPRI